MQNSKSQDGTATDSSTNVEVSTSSSHNAKPNVSRCGLSDPEYYEREMLLEKQRIRTEWFSQENFERLKVLSEKMFANAGSPHIG